MSSIKGREGDNLNRLLMSPAVTSMILVSAWLCVDVRAETNPSVSGDTPYFSNKDLEQYKMPSDNKTTYRKIRSTETKKEEVEGKKELREQEYWCKKATSYKRKIERGRDDISEMEKELSAETGKRKKNIALEKRIAKARKQIAYVEKDMADFEDEARRKDIPPGWLRCQFE